VLPGVTGTCEAAQEACPRIEAIRDAEVAELEIGGADAWSSAGRCQDPCLGKLCIEPRSPTHVSARRHLDLVDMAPIGSGATVRERNSFVSSVPRLSFSWRI
jgi:hypothetical protein